MSTVTGSAAIFLIAFSLALLILIAHRKILPRLGIWIGSETYPASIHAQVIQDKEKSQ